MSDDNQMDIRESNRCVEKPVISINFALLLFVFGWKNMQFLKIFLLGFIRGKGVFERGWKDCFVVGRITTGCFLLLNCSFDATNANYRQFLLNSRFSIA